MSELTIQTTVLATYGVDTLEPDILIAEDEYMRIFRQNSNNVCVLTRFGRLSEVGTSKNNTCHSPTQKKKSSVGGKYQNIKSEHPARSTHIVPQCVQF